MDLTNTRTRRRTDKHTNRRQSNFMCLAILLDALKPAKLLNSRFEFLLDYSTFLEQL